MFNFKKNKQPTIDPLQKELIENAQRRIKEKRGLFTHFIVFLVGAVGLIIISQLLIKTDPLKILDIEWWIWVLFIWLLILIYHSFKVFITNRLLGPEWEKRQYNRLVTIQQERLQQIEQQVVTAHPVSKLAQPIAANQPDRVITMIAAAGANNELGIDGKLPWHLPDDFKRFKTLTTGHHIIMGRKTFESFPKPLANRIHIILTRDPNYQTDDAIVVHDLDTALAACATDHTPYIIGGGQIYEQALAIADRIELTRVHNNFEADTFFPELDHKQWHLVHTQEHPADDRHQFAFDFETWERKK